MAEKLISVIIPIYRVEPYLKKCIDSVCAQTYRNLQIILVDDGSPDSCGSICDKYAKEDPRITVIHKENGGLSSARNAGLDIAEGEYIAFVDSDDSIKADMLELLCDSLEKNDADMSLCGIELEDINGRTIGKVAPKEETVLGEDDFWRFLYYQNELLGVVAWNKLYRHELFEGVRYVEGKVHEDEYILHRLVSRCLRISLLPESKYIYLQRPNSISAATSVEKLLDGLEAFIDRGSYFVEREKSRFAERAAEAAMGVFSSIIMLPVRPDEVERVSRAERRLKELLREIDGRSTRFLVKRFLFLWSPKLFRVVMSVCYSCRDTVKRLIAIITGRDAARG